MTQSTDSHAPRLILRVSIWTFRFFWLVVLVTHASLCAFYAWMIRLHYYLDKVVKVLREVGYLEDPVLLGYQDLALALDVLTIHHPFFAMTVASALIVAGHGLEIALMVGHTIHQRQFCFDEPANGPSKLSFDTFRHISAKFGNFAPFRQYTRRLYVCTLPLRGCFSWFSRVYKAHPLLIVLLLEIVEVASQTAQAYRMSFYVDSPWINRTFVLATITNCWSSTIVYLIFRRSPALERFVAMIVDAFLNVLQTVLIPWMIVYPHFRDTPRTNIVLKGTRYESPLGSLQLNYNIQQLFPSSWASFLAIITPGFAMLGCMLVIKKSILPPDTSVHPKPAPTTDDVQTMHAVVPATTRKKSKAGILSVLAGIHVMLTLWGFVILVVHIYASHIGNQSDNVGCMVSNRPWLTSKYTCSLMDLDCSKNRILGHRSEIEDILQRLSTTNLQQMIISDCPELEIPRGIQSFPELFYFVIYNSSLVVWDEDAALTSEAHPVLAYVYMIQTNLTSVPSALLHVNVPGTLVDIGFSGTNLTSFPDDAHISWTTLTKIVLEASPGITTIPDSVYQLPIGSQVSLVGNSISTIPDDLFVNSMWTQLQLAGNPLTRLPATLGLIFMMGIVDITATQVAMIPEEWLSQYTESTRWMLFAGATPLCARLAADDVIIDGNPSVRAEAIEDTPLVWRLGSLTISCLDTKVVRDLPG